MNQKTGQATKDPVAVLGQYHNDPRPIWLWDRLRARVLWANTAALAFWGEQSVADLSLRDLGRDGPLIQTLISKSEELNQGKRVRKILTLKPAAKPRRTVLDLAPYPVTGYPGSILIVASIDQLGPAVPSRLNEVFHLIPAPLTLFGLDGKPLVQNMAADALFGPVDQTAAPHNLFKRMAHANHARALYTTALSSASAARVSPVISARGTERMRVALRRVADPTTGEIALLAMYEDIPSPLAHASHASIMDRDSSPTASVDSDVVSANLQDAVMETLQAAGVGIITVDREGDISSFSQGASAILGIDGPDAEGKNFTTYLTTVSTPKFMDYLHHSPSVDDPDFIRGIEITGVNRYGKELPLQIQIRAIPGQEDQQYCVVIRDVSDWKSALLQLDQARKKAEDSSAAGPQLLANISHELRTPLNAILGFTELMQLETFGPIGSEKYKEYLTDISESGSHVLSLINDLLDLSKTEAGHMDLELQMLDVGRAISASERFVGPQVLGSRITLESHIAPGLPNLNADSRALRQVLVNLLSNAVRATPKGGRISTTARLDDKGQMLIEVRDTGVGMTKDQIQQALKPYGQVGNNIAGKSGGTGLGLPLAKALTHAHNAQFSIASEPGKGTAVRLTFPATATQPA